MNLDDKTAERCDRTPFSQGIYTGENYMNGIVSGFRYCSVIGEPPDIGKQQRCEVCDGSGESDSHYEDGSPRPCPECKGNGFVMVFE